MVTGRLAIITGSGRGIGKAIAEQLAGHGCHTALLSRSLRNVQPLAEQLQNCSGNTNHIAYECNPTNLDQVNECIRSICRDLGPPTLLVNNAGSTSDQIMLRQTLHEFNATLSANLTSAWIMSKVFVRAVLQQESASIVNIGSTVGLDGQQGQIAYSAAKAGLLGLTKSMSKEYGSRGIRVNMIAPGFIQTLFLELHSNLQVSIANNTSLKRMGSASEVASVVRFLLSSDASFITGQCIRVDGGLSMPLFDPAR